MTIVLAIGFCLEAAAIIWLSKIVHRHESDIFNSEFKIEALQRKIDGYKESVDVLSTSVRKLNGVVKDLEQKQPKIEPKNRMNTRVFIAGWDADETEPEDPVKKHIVDICLNGTAEQKQDLIDALALQNILSSQTQQCNYPLQTGQLQSSAMLPPQQCILPLPFQQTPSGAILPLWFINKRLEDM